MEIFIKILPSIYTVPTLNLLNTGRKRGSIMARNRRTIRGIDDAAWKMLVEVREISRINTGALVSDALRFWYDRLPCAEDIDALMALEH